MGVEVRERFIPVITRLAKIKSAKLQSTTIDLDCQRAIKILQPPILIAVSSKNHQMTSLGKEDYAASVCALHNMVLSRGTME